MLDLVDAGVSLVTLDLVPNESVLCAPLATGPELVVRDRRVAGMIATNLVMY